MVESVSSAVEGDRPDPLHCCRPLGQVERQLMAENRIAKTASRASPSAPSGRVKPKVRRVRMRCMDCTIRAMRRDEVELAIEMAATEGWNPSARRPMAGRHRDRAEMWLTVTDTGPASSSRRRTSPGSFRIRPRLFPSSIPAR